MRERKTSEKAIGMANTQLEAARARKKRASKQIAAGCKKERGRCKQKGGGLIATKHQRGRKKKKNGRGAHVRTAGLDCGGTSSGSSTAAPQQNHEERRGGRSASWWLFFLALEEEAEEGTTDSTSFWCRSCSGSCCDGGEDDCPLSRRLESAEPEPDAP